MDKYMIDGVEIRTPITYKPQGATTSTEDSDRTQDLVMHNTPMGTILRYDMTWGNLSTEEVRTILNGITNKEQFQFHHFDIFQGWITKPYYASNWNVECVKIVEEGEVWQGLTINFIAINPITGQPYPAE